MQSHMILFRAAMVTKPKAPLSQSTHHDQTGDNRIAASTRVPQAQAERG